MCGITGFFDFRKNSTIGSLQEMTESLKHRGPDASNCNIIESSNALIGLGHTRLSIIDLSEHGNQPMCFLNHWICFNGEVYNFKEIKKKLEGLGHQFTGTSDTEVVLHSLIHRVGRKMLGRICGYVCFCYLQC